MTINSKIETHKHEEIVYVINSSHTITTYSHTESQTQTENDDKID